MKLLVMILPMWACFYSLFSFVLAARQDTTVSNFFSSGFVVVKEPISQFSAKMEAQSPGLSTIATVFVYECCLFCFKSSVL